MSDFLPYLFSLIEDASGALPAVSHRRMFGADALFADGNIFALVLKEGRIGVRLPVDAAAAELLALPGAERWFIGEKRMGHWILVPEAFHDDRAALARWVHGAHALAMAAGPKAPKKPPRRDKKT